MFVYMIYDNMKKSLEYYWCLDIRYWWNRIFELIDLHDMFN